MLVYLLGFGVALYITHKEEDTEDHENVGMQCMAWPLFLAMTLIMMVFSIPAYFSKLVKRLVG